MALCDAGFSPEVPVEKKKKAKSGLREGFSVVLGNPRIRNLALLVVGYGVSHRLFEFAWKGQLRVLYPSPLEYQGMLSNVSMAQGVLSIVMMVVGRWVFRQLGWVRAPPLLGCFFSSIPSAIGLVDGSSRSEVQILIWTR
jgi:ATP/ADP translocase